MSPFFVQHTADTLCTVCTVMYIHNLFGSFAGGDIDISRYTIGILGFIRNDLPIYLF